MSDLSGAIEGFYSKFVLRDFLGKITPGMVWLLGVGTAMISPRGMWELITEINLFSGIVMLGFAWITGILFQSRGEISKRLDYTSQDIDSNSTEWYQIYLRLRMDAPPQIIAEHERFVFIMEACGNTASVLRSLVPLIPLLWVIRTVLYHFYCLNWRWEDLRGEFVGLIVSILVSTSFAIAEKGFQKFHEAHRERQELLLKTALKLLDNQKSPSNQKRKGK